MTLAERIAAIEAAASQPGGLALRTVAQLTDGEPDLLRALETAAIPFAWNAALLSLILPPDLTPHADDLHQRLVALSVCEPYLSRPGFSNVHEVTRQALRGKLHAEGTLSVHSARAFSACGEPSESDTPQQRITRVYHHLLAAPEAGAEALETLYREWSKCGRWSDLLDLAAALEELLPHLAPAARARALFRRACIRADRSPAPEIAAQVKESAELFEQTGHQRGLAHALTRCGNLAVAQGDLAGAMRRFTDSHTILERLAASDPANAAWQRDLVVSHNKLGDLAVAQGDLPGALRRFTDALRIAERLAASDPANAEWQRDLSVAHNRLGDLAVAQGDMPGAMRRFTDALRIAERLAASDPANAEWQRDLSVAHERLGNFAVAQGDMPGAMRHFAADLAIAERLAASDPANATWQFDLGITNERLGNLAVAQGKLDEARVFHTKRNGIIAKLAASDPANAEWQRDLYVSYWKLARLSEKDGKPADAKGWWCKAHDTLASMKQRGLHLSPEDEGFLARLRAKVAD